MLEVIAAQWAAPANVKALSTTRHGGVSGGAYASLNLGDHVGDDPACVKENRQRVQDQLHLPSAPVWLEQVHGTTVLRLDGSPLASNQADASMTTRAGVVCAVMTADCLPVVFCNRAGNKVAVAHAGWRGLAHGVLEETLRALAEPPEQLLVWLGPAIGSRAFEVGDEVLDEFARFLPRASQAFTATGRGSWLADIYLLARQRLAHCGLTAISGGEHCTYSETDRFYSYRRDGVTGRMATLVWFDE